MSFSPKKLYRRFKAWQVHPADVSHSDEPHRCNNCGLEFTGRFCPDCGQRDTAGRITWQVVRDSLMDVWGLGGRSLPYSMWQLIWRPGYFISDYINGKRQSSFPPFKMLVLVAVALYFVGKATFPEYWSSLIEYDASAITSTGWQYYYELVSQWVGNHIEWMFLLVFSVLILPTRLLFRHSPRNSRHTIPQGFFIQVFLTTQYFIWVFILSSFVRLAGMDFGYDTGSLGFKDQMAYCSLLLIPAIVIIDYKQLFGYGWWGTLWRVLVMTCAIVLGFGALTLMQNLGTHPDYAADVDGGRTLVMLLCMLIVWLICLMLSVTDVVNRRLWRERGWLRAMMLPLLLLVPLIIVCICMEVIRPGVLLKLFK